MRSPKFPCLLYLNAHRFHPPHTSAAHIHCCVKPNIQPDSSISTPAASNSRDAVLPFILVFPFFLKQYLIKRTLQNMRYVTISILYSFEQSQGGNGKNTYTERSPVSPQNGDRRSFCYSIIRRGSYRPFRDFRGSRASAGTSFRRYRTFCSPRRSYRRD